jgi:hypothetical protein
MHRITNDLDFTKEFLKFVKVSADYHPQPQDFTEQEVIHSVRAKDFDKIKIYLSSFRKYLDQNCLEDMAYINKAQAFLDYIENK